MVDLWKSGQMSVKQRVLRTTSAIPLGDRQYRPQRLLGVRLVLEAHAIAFSARFDQRHGAHIIISIILTLNLGYYLDSQPQVDSVGLLVKVLATVASTL
jgi:hypothetical protein